MKLSSSGLEAGTFDDYVEVVQTVALRITHVRHYISGSLFIIDLSFTYDADNFVMSMKCLHEYESCFCADWR